MIFGSIFKQFFKYVVIFLLCLVPLVVIGAGVYSGLRVYEHKQQHSETFGDITYHDVYEDFNVFDCDLSDAIFYPKNSGYEYNLTIDKSVKFNGSVNKYNVLLNNQPSDTEASTAGILTAQNVINLYNINGVQTDKITLGITIKFYQTSVEISISNNNTASQQSQFLTYQKFNGLHLRVIESQYTKPASEKQYYTISFIDYDNSVISIERVYKGAQIVKPANPERVGYQFTGWSPAVPAVADKDYTFVATYEASEAYLRIIKDNIAQELLYKSYVTDALAEREVPISNVYPVLTVTTDNQSHYFDPKPDLSQAQNFDIIITGNTVSFCGLSYTFTSNKGWYIVIEFFDMSVSYVIDNLYYEYDL